MWDWFQKVAELSGAKDGVPSGPFAVVTIVSCSGSTPAAVGSKLVVLPNGGQFGTVGGGHLEQLVVEDAKRAIEAAASKMHRYPLGAKAGQCCGGVVDAFIEVMGIGPRLYLFGAGHVAQAVCRTLVGTPFAIHVVDERTEWLSQLPNGVREHAEPWEDFVGVTPWDDDRTFVAIMTHRHDLDEEIVWSVTGKSARYIGLIGSQTKWNRFKHRLVLRGATEERLARVKCPIGLDIGGKSPQEVAVSVAAELLKVWHAR